MRTDCRHHSRRTLPDGEVERCAVDATTAIGECPTDCAMFEARRVTTIGFEQGSLAAGGTTSALPEGVEAAEDLLAEVAGILDASGEDAVVAEEERRHAEERRRARRKRRRIN